MDLFGYPKDQPINLLRRDGVANYYGPVMCLSDANHSFDILLNHIEWKNDEVIIFGKKIVTKRKVAWHADAAFEYTYSKTTRRALPWTRELLKLKYLVEQHTGEIFNSCLLNLYHDGSESVGWHSDGEKDLKRHGAIGSLSLGAQRKFSFKHKKTKETASLTLENGSLLVMKEETQAHWAHCLPPTKAVTSPRISLTFRTIVDKNINR